MTERAKTVEQAKQDLATTNYTIALAADWLFIVMPTIEQFLEEQKHVDSVMPILDPTRWMDPERQAVAEMLDPVYRAAKTFVEEAHKARAIATHMATSK